MKPGTNIVLLLVLSFSLPMIMTGCTSKQEKWRMQLEKSAAEANRSVENLAKHLNAGTISKANLLKQYATIVKRQSPELTELIDTLSLDATVEGPSYKNLVARLSEVNASWSSTPQQGFTNVQASANEMFSIQTAAKTDIYGMMLTDPINVLADMSKGTLGRVESMSKQASLAANNAADYGTGSQLVGNPQYGQWRSNSSGSSFWEWYGKYALFSSLFRSPIYYGSWSGRRNYSYYGESGRNYYNSPRQNQRSKQTETRTRSKFKREGKRFQSPYASSKSGSRVATMQRNSFRKAKSSSPWASSRSSSYRTSRGSFRGK